MQCVAIWRKKINSFERKNGVWDFEEVFCGRFFLSFEMELMDLLD